MTDEGVMQHVLDAMGCAVVIVQGEAFRYVNDAAAAISGYTRKELMGMRFYDIVHPEYQSEVKAAGFLHQSGSLSPECREIKIICKDGREAWLLAIVSSTEFKGRPVSISVLIEMPARNAWETRLHYIIDDSADLICRWHTGGILTYVNRAFCRYFNKTREELIGSSFHLLLPPELQEKIWQFIASCTPDNHLTSMVNRVIGADGRSCWQHWVIQCIFSQEGRVVEFQSVGRDITAQKEAEVDREEYRMHLEAIFNSVPDAIVTVDQDMRVLRCNEAFKVHSGMTELHHDLRLCEGPVSCSRACHDAVRETLANGRAVREYRVACERADRLGQVSVVNTYPLKDRQGRFLGVLVVIRDITAITQLEQRLGERASYRRIVGASPRMQELFQHIDSLADQDMTVLITGESGTGKELVAEALHYGGRRSLKPLVKVNCSALVENLLESELFGHVKGAFTGAARSRNGRFQKAQGGTIFLDEIGDISPRIQLKLLRVLEEKTFEPVGDTKSLRVDVRIVAATNQNLQEKVRRGEFRQDLFYRLNVMQLNVPSLRERREDITLLTNHFLAVFSKKFNKTIGGVAHDVFNRFLDYPWPGNVRELEHVLERACLLCQEAEINLKDLPVEIGEWQGSGGAMPAGDLNNPQRLLQMLSQTGWNVSKAARLIGVSRPTLYRRMVEAGLTRPT